MSPKNRKPKVPAKAGSPEQFSKLITELEPKQYVDTCNWCQQNADFCRRTSTPELAQHMIAQLGFPITVAELTRIREVLNLPNYTLEERLISLEAQVAELKQQARRKDTELVDEAIRRARARDSFTKHPMHPVPPRFISAPPAFGDPGLRPMCMIRLTRPTGQ